LKTRDIRSQNRNEFQQLFAKCSLKIIIVNNNEMQCIVGRPSFLLWWLTIYIIFAAEKLRIYAEAVTKKGATLDNCFVFADGTVRPICRPKEKQRIVYNGHVQEGRQSKVSLNCPS
jgi:hypothetical protein